MVIGIDDIYDYCEIDGNYVVENKVINVFGSVSFLTDGVKLSKIPFRFGRVSEDFTCSNLGLTSLDYCPEFVGAEFHCDLNKITSLEGGPLTVGDNYHCYDNRLLTSLEGAPDIVKGCFYIDWNPKLPMLSLLKYNEVTIYENKIVRSIIHEYAGKKPLRQAIIQCQRALIDAGFRDNARL